MSVSKAKVIASAEKSLDRAIKYFANQGVEINFRPTIGFIDDVSPSNPDAVASVQLERAITMINLRPETSTFMLQLSGESEFRDYCGLTVSDEAITQLVTLIMSKIRPITTIQDTIVYEEDITLFRIYATAEFTQAYREIAIRHELWHCLEQQFGIMEQTPYILEGTATYASLGNQDFYTIPEQCLNETDLMYDGASWVIQKYVKDRLKPLIAILDGPLREEMQKELLWRSRKGITQRMLLKLEDPNYRSIAKASLLKIPEFQKLDGRCSEVTILRAYEELGANKLVEEIKSQSLARLVELFKKVGF